MSKSKQEIADEVFAKAKELEALMTEAYNVGLEVNVSSADAFATLLYKKRRWPSLDVTIRDKPPKPVFYKRGDEAETSK